MQHGCLKLHVVMWYMLPCHARHALYARNGVWSGLLFCAIAVNEAVSFNTTRVRMRITISFLVFSRLHGSKTINHFDKMIIYFIRPFAAYIWDTWYVVYVCTLQFIYYFRWQNILFHIFLFVVVIAKLESFILVANRKKVDA